MSEANQFRQYAKEALGWVGQSTTEEDKRTLTDLACMWAQAALQSERIFGGDQRLRLSWRSCVSGRVGKSPCP